LVFDETHAVGIATTSQTSSHTSKHTLSESDRRALCFAFFTSSVINDPACADLIVILDDPVSSFDTDRRNNTVKYLKRMRGSSSTPDQIIILTHDKDFLRTLGSDIRDDAKTLILEWNPSTSTSDFKELDTSNHQLFMDNYYRRLNELESYLLLPDSELNIGHLQNVRHVIENVMKRKYYRLLSNDIRDKQSLETFITTLILPGNPYENNQSLIDDIRSLLPHQVHHDQDNPGGYDVNALGSADIRRIITDALAIIQRL
jgi:wobble nucleotide-excising tRNase